jgi:hypothetical protein
MMKIQQMVQFEEAVEVLAGDVGEAFVVLNGGRAFGGAVEPHGDGVAGVEDSACAAVCVFAEHLKEPAHDR